MVYMVDVIGFVDVVWWLRCGLGYDLWLKFVVYYVWIRNGLGCGVEYMVLVYYVWIWIDTYWFICGFA